MRLGNDWMPAPKMVGCKSVLPSFQCLVTRRQPCEDAAQRERSLASGRAHQVQIHSLGQHVRVLPDGVRQPRRADDERDVDSGLEEIELGPEVVLP